MITDVLDLRRTAQAGFLAIVQDFLEQMCVLRFLRRSVNQTRVRRRVLRLKLSHRFKVGGVSDDFGKFLQLFELIQFCFSPLLFSNYSAHNILPSFVQRTPQRQIDNDKVGYARRLLCSLGGNSGARPNSSL